MEVTKDIDNISAPTVRLECTTCIMRIIDTDNPVV